jgi:glycosyltransferase involved in cell wall biosynthesis
MYMYAPYEKEMQLWAKYAGAIEFCCPIWQNDKNLLISKVSFSIQPTVELKDFDVTSLKNAFLAIPSIISNLFVICKAMKQADHIHLRCPGNIALLACFVQILFPNKKKTAKYAGNWDPNAKQPLSYRLQKWILSNTFLTKNIQVLVYGKWENSTKNIKPFFTATYSKKEIKEVGLRNFKEVIDFVFVGMLSEGKQPLYASKLIKELVSKNYNVRLRYFGDGVLKNELIEFINDNKLQNFVSLKGNQSKEVVEKAYQESHFLILPSKSEGWPKVVAEAMFWGCVPLVTSVSCVSFMLNRGNRGVLLTEELMKDTNTIEALLLNHEEYSKKAKSGMDWSREYTIDKFENEIQRLLIKEF